MCKCGTDSAGDASLSEASWDYPRAPLTFRCLCVQAAWSSLQAVEPLKLKSYSGHSAAWGDHNFLGLELKAVWVSLLHFQKLQNYGQTSQMSLISISGCEQLLSRLSSYIKAISVDCKGSLITYYACRPFLLDSKSLILSWIPFL